MFAFCGGTDIGVAVESCSLEPIGLTNSIRCGEEPNSREFVGEVDFLNSMAAFSDVLVGEDGGMKCVPVPNVLSDGAADFTGLAGATGVAEARGERAEPSVGIAGMCG